MGWVATPKLIDRRVTAGIATGTSLAEVSNALLAKATAAGVGGVFAATDVAQYEITISPSIAVLAVETAPQVFVAGMADTSELGIYVCDPSNRWPFGDLSADPKWRAKPGTRLDLINANTGASLDDAYLTFDRARGRLTYTGADPGALPRLYDAQWKIDGRLFAPFTIRIQRPTFSYGDQSYEQLTGIAGVPHVAPQNQGLGNAIAVRFNAASPDNLVLLTPSTQPIDRYYVGPISKFDNGIASCYFVGVPGKTVLGGANHKPTNCVVKRAGVVVWKNLDVQQWKLGTEDCGTHVIDRFRSRNLKANDAVMFDNTTQWFPADVAQTAFVVNAEFTRCGQSGNKHPIYIHLRDTPLGSKSGASAHTHFNNVWSYGNNSAPMKNGVGPQGGCNVKCLSKYVTLRNSFLDQSDNWADLANSYVSSQPTSLHAHQHAIVYNTWIRWFNSTIQNFGADKGLFFQNRNLADSGHDDPPYFLEDPPLPAVPPYTPLNVPVTVNVATNTFSFAETLVPNAVTFATTGTLPAPLQPGTAYYTLNATKTSCRLALTDGAGPVIDLTDAGSGTHTMRIAPKALTLNTGYHGDNDYQREARAAPYWAAVTQKPITDPENAHAYHKFISYCRFEFVTAPIEPQQVAAAIADQGNPPCAPTRQFEPAQNYYAVPLNWVERSQVFLGNNTYVGFASGTTKVRRWDGASAPSVGVRFPFSVDPFKPRPDPIVAGGERNDGEPVADVPLPDYFFVEAA